MTRSAGDVSWQMKLLEDAEKKQKLLNAQSSSCEGDNWQMKLLQDAAKKKEAESSFSQQQQKQKQQHVVPPSPGSSTMTAAVIAAAAAEITWHRELVEESGKTKESSVQRFQAGLLSGVPQSSTNPRGGDGNADGDVGPKNGTGKKDEPQSDASQTNAGQGGGGGTLKKAEAIMEGRNSEGKDKHVQETNEAKCEERNAGEPEVEVVCISDEESDVSPPTTPKAPPPPLPPSAHLDQQPLFPTRAPTTPKAPPPPPPKAPKAPPPPPPCSTRLPTPPPAIYPRLPSPPPPIYPTSSPPRSTTPPKAPPPATKAAPPPPPSLQPFFVPTNTLLTPKKEEEVPPPPCTPPTPSTSPLASILKPLPEAAVRRSPTNASLSIPKRAVLFPRAQAILAQHHESAADILTRRCTREVSENVEREEDVVRQEQGTNTLLGPEKEEEVPSTSPLSSILKPLPEAAVRRPLRSRAEAILAQKGESTAQILARWASESVEREKEEGGEGEEGGEEGEGERTGVGAENRTSTEVGHGEIAEVIYIRSHSESLSREEQAHTSSASSHHGPAKEEGERRRSRSRGRKRQSRSRHGKRGRGVRDVERCGRDRDNSRSRSRGRNVASIPRTRTRTRAPRRGGLAFVRRVPSPMIEEVSGNASNCRDRHARSSLRSRRSSNGLLKKQGSGHSVETINSKGASEVDEHGVRSPKRRRLEFRSNSVETIHSKSASEVDEHGVRSPKRRRLEFRSGIPMSVDRPLSDYVIDMQRGLF